MEPNPKAKSEDRIANENVKKKTRLKGHERRDQILRTATEVFSKYGFHGSSMRRIARAAGVSEAMIYHHFPGKEALYDAILEKKLERSRHLYFPIQAAEAGQDREVIETIVGNYLREQKRDNSFMRVLLFSALEDHELARKFVGKPLQDYFGFLGSYFEKRMKDGAMRNMDPQVLARLLIGMVHFLALLQGIYKDPGIRSVGIEDLKNLTVDLFCKGIMEDSGYSI